jgi:hypothetical protein
MLQIDEETNHVMRTSLLDHGYGLLAWPKDTPRKWLAHLREIVVFQLDTLINEADRKTAREKAADAEYESWFAAPSAGKPAPSAPEGGEPK